MVVEWPLSEVERVSVPEGKLSTLRMGVSQLDKSRWFRAGSFFSLSVRAVGPRAWVTWTSLGWTSERNQKRLTPIVGWN